MDEPTTRWATRKRFDFDDFAPWAEPHQAPGSPDLLFGLLRWVVELATRDDEARARRSPNYHMRPISERERSLWSLMHNHSRGLEPRCTINPARWRSSVLEILGRALRARPDYLTRAGVALGKSRVVSVRHLVAAADQWNGGRPVYTASPVLALADYVGRTARDVWNPHHTDIRRVCRVVVTVRPEGYSLVASLAEVNDPDCHDHDPLWLYAPYTFTLGAAAGDCFGPTVAPVKGEAFSEFVERAHAAMESLLEPADEVRWFVWTVCSLDAGNKYRGPLPRTGCPEAYVLAPTAESAVAWWREEGRVPVDVRLSATANSCDPAALLPTPAPGRDFRSAVSLRRAAPPSDEIGRARGHNEREILRTLLRLSRAPYRSTLRAHTERAWPDAGKGA